MRALLLGWRLRRTARHGVRLAEATPGTDASHARADAPTRRPRRPPDRSRQIGRLPGACPAARRADAGHLTAARAPAGPDRRPQRPLTRPPDSGPGQLGGDARSSNARRSRKSAPDERNTCSSPRSSWPTPTGWLSFERYGRPWWRSTRPTACPPGATTSARTTYSLGSAIAALAPKTTTCCAAGRGAPRSWRSPRRRRRRYARTSSSRLGCVDPETAVTGLDRPNLYLEATHCPTEEHRWRRLLTLLDSQRGTVESRTCRPAGRPRSWPSGCAKTGTPPSITTVGWRPVSAASDTRTSWPGVFRSWWPRRRSAWASTSPTSAGWPIWRLPDSPDSYLQEIGRAGRDGRPGPGGAAVPSRGRGTAALLQLRCAAPRRRSVTWWRCCANARRPGPSSETRQRLRRAEAHPAGHLSDRDRSGHRRR